MTRKRARPRRAPAAPGPIPPSAPAPARKANPRLEADLLAAWSVLLCAVLGAVSASALSPDGVSYLDLAGELRRGDWAHFVQGYWSPLYPALIALVSLVSGREGPGLIPAVHVLNVIIAIVAVALLWVVARSSGSVAFVRGSFAALLLCSTRPPRVDAVTPDLLLLCVVLAAAIELAYHDGRRWLLLGTLLGIAFLAKTSTWPWLLGGMAARLLLARGADDRKLVLRSSVVCAAVMLLWVVPLSRAGGRVSLGSAGRLNACWYLEACDSRTPDTHRGHHQQYRTAQLPGGAAITWASFDGAPGTYPPWSDPTAWARGVVSRSGSVPDAGALVVYWATTAGYVFGMWLMPVMLAVLVPVAWISWRPLLWSELRTSQHGAMVAMVLGVMGVGQFIAIHAEPRLIAPFGMMLALGALVWLCARPGTLRIGPALTTVATSLGLATALAFSASSVQDSWGLTRRIDRRMEAIDAVRRRLSPGGVPHGRIVIVGPAVPFIMDAYRLGGRIVAQVLPYSADLLAMLPMDQQQQVVDQLFRGQADAVWYTRADETFRIAPVARP